MTRSSTRGQPLQADAASAICADRLTWCGTLLVSLVASAACMAGEADTAAPLSGWQYHRTVTLEPPTKLPGDVVLVVFTTDTFGSPYRHLKPDGSDLRFTTADALRPLHYWIERWDSAGVSKIWVKVADAGTEKVLVWYGNADAAPVSAGSRVFDFFDDFDDGIWTKYSGNPVMTRTEPWEARAICEPSVIHEDGIFKMWYMGCQSSAGHNAALGYATSPDGLAWTKHPGNPILRDPKDAVIRTTVIKHRGTYYLFASDHQWTKETGAINRWVSKDGLNWTDKTTVLRPTQPWEDHFHNVHVVVDEDGTWKMLYTTDGPWGYAHSADGLHWTKHKDPVVTGFYGGDPFLKKIGENYYAWHSRAHQGHLRIYSRSSPDMIHWKETYNDPQLGYTQPWERGIGRSEVHWDRHLADAELLEHDGRVIMYYGGAQCPLGVAVFDGTFEQLAARLEQPPLSQWAPSHYGCVENKELKISDTETDTEPICQRASRSGDRGKYVVEFRARCYAGYRQEQARTESEGWSTGTKCYPASTRRVAVVMRYLDDNNFARFRTEDDETTYYEERLGGVWGPPTNVGPSRAGDTDVARLEGRCGWRGQPTVHRRQTRRRSQEQSGPGKPGRLEDWLLRSRYLRELR